MNAEKNRRFVGPVRCGRTGIGVDDFIIVIDGVLSSKKLSVFYGFFN